jgi:hypothetical protein
VIPASGVSCEVIRDDGTRAAVFHVEHRPILNITFDVKSKAVTTYRTFEFIRRAVKTSMTTTPMLVVDPASRLAPFADRMMTRLPVQLYHLG